MYRGQVVKSWNHPITATVGLTVKIGEPSHTLCAICLSGPSVTSRRMLIQSAPSGCNRAEAAPLQIRVTMSSSSNNRYQSGGGRLIGYLIPGGLCTVVCVCLYHCVCTVTANSVLRIFRGITSKLSSCNCHELSAWASGGLVTYCPGGGRRASDWCALNQGSVHWKLNHINGWSNWFGGLRVLARDRSLNDLLVSKGVLLWWGCAECSYSENKMGTWETILKTILKSAILKMIEEWCLTCYNL